MASLQAVLLCLFCPLLLRALRLHRTSQPYKQDDSVKVLVFGDSWGESGPSYKMLQDMFALQGVRATVKSTAVGGTRACQWAEVETSLADKAREQFPTSGPDFVWYTLGGNDLLDPKYQKCQKNAKNDNTALACLATVTKQIRKCSSTLLDHFWDVYPKTKVVQCGYDLSCDKGKCIPMERYPYCGLNASCAHYQKYAWQNMMLDELNKKYDRYTGINILGTLQVLSHMDNSSIGHPSFSQGTPCEMVWGCVHPIPGSPASIAIGEQFWKKFFGLYVNTTDALKQAPPKREHSFFELQNDGDMEVARTKCMWDWTPSIRDKGKFHCGLDVFANMK